MPTSTFQKGINGYSGATDTYLRASKADRNYAAAGEIWVDGADSAGQEMQALLQFSDIFGNSVDQIPLGATITSATLTLNVTDGSGDGAAFYRMAQDWASQPDLTWNAFGSGVQTDGVEALADPDLALSSVSTGSTTFDVSQSLQAWSDGAQNSGWLLRTPGSNGWSFSSSESVAPVLTVTYENPSDPVPALVVVETDGQTMVTEGGEGDVISVALNAAPTQNVTVSVSTSAGGDATISPSTLTFTPGNWDTPQQVTVAAIDDAAIEGDEDFLLTLTAASGDTEYDGLSEFRALTVVDNDFSAPPPPPPPPPPGASTTLSFRESVNGYSGTRDTHIRESRSDRSYADASDVWIDGSDSSGGEIQALLKFSDMFGTSAGQIPLGATITSATLTLNVTDGSGDGAALFRMLQDWTLYPQWTWDTLGSGVQTDGVEARATPDLALSSVPVGTTELDVSQSLQAWSNGAENAGWLLQTFGSNGWSFSSSESVGPVLDVTYTIPGDPVPALVVVETDGQTIVTEGGEGDVISVALSAAPTQNVTVSVSTSAGGDATISPSTLTFTPGNWDTPQQVAVAAIDDVTAESTEEFLVTLTTSSADPDYDGLSASRALTVIDNDFTAPPLSPEVVAIHDATQFSAGDPSGTGAADPSGIAYVPGQDLLYIVDSEHDESPFFSPTNLFTIQTDGTQVGSNSLISYTDEPTGIAYNPHNGLLYISDDDAGAIFVVHPDDPSTLIDAIDVDTLGLVDVEDPVIDPVTGNIYMLDGFQTKLYEMTDLGVMVNVTALSSELTDAEALTFDPDGDVFYISSGSARGKIYQVSRDGDVLEDFSLSDYRHPDTGSKPKIKGLELAPSSDPNDGDHMSLYAVDYGSDQYADGRVFEINLYSDWLLT